MRAYSREEVIEELKKQIAGVGCQRQWAMKHGFSQVNVHQVLNNQKPMGHKMAKALGFKRKYFYVKEGEENG